MGCAIWAVWWEWEMSLHALQERYGVYKEEPACWQYAFWGHEWGGSVYMAVYTWYMPTYEWPLVVHAWGAHLCGSEYVGSACLALGCACGGSSCVALAVHGGEVCMVVYTWP
eukprot:79753-Pelagomonas_calceolata.AAC.13